MDIGCDGTNNYNYTFTGVGFTQTTNDPDLYLARGRVYEFVNGMGSHPFQIQDTQNGSVGNPYDNGVTNNGASNGTIKFEVPFNSPDTLYYQCSHTLEWVELFSSIQLSDNPINTKKLL